MKRAAAVGMILALFVMTGCAKEGGAASWKKVSETYGAITTADATAKITADSGVWMEYEVEAHLAEGACSTTITAPEEIAGITATVRGSEAELAFDDVSLDTLLPSVPGFTPMDCIDGMLRTLAGAVPTEECKEMKNKRDCVALTYEMEAKEYRGSKRIWLDQKTLDPVFMELYLGEDRILHCDFSAFEMQ